MPDYRTLEDLYREAVQDLDDILTYLKVSPLCRTHLEGLRRTCDERRQAAAWNAYVQQRSEQAS